LHDERQRNRKTKTVKLPSNLIEIRQVASSMFLDPAVISVEVQATFGMVTVYRDGEIKMA